MKFKLEVECEISGVSDCENNGASPVREIRSRIAFLLGMERVVMVDGRAEMMAIKVGAITKIPSANQ